MVVLLIPARTDTAYFHDYIYGKAEIRFLRGRLHFEDEDGNRFPPAPFPSMVVIYNGDHQCFQRMKQTHPAQYKYCIYGGHFENGELKPDKTGLGLGKILDYIGKPH